MRTLALLRACALLVLCAWNTVATAAPAITEADLDAFFDGAMAPQLARNDIAGAVVTVVGDGRVLFAKGYGYADVQRRVPVDPRRTLFRIGSVSKLLTWTAVMQLAGQGKLDLDADINRHLDFAIVHPSGAAITMRHLMTHTAGFEESYQGLFVRDAAHMAGLGEYLRRHRPALVYRPGQVAAYSNYGAALAGYIVQRVSGQPFGAYIGQHITGPLGMRDTTFEQPLPAALAGRMAQGYRTASGAAQDFELFQGAPAGGATSSAADMARFMLAHLQPGQAGLPAVLAPPLVGRMHARERAFGPREQAMTLGFYEESRNGQRIIGHGGDTYHFHADLHLLPDAGVGLFIAYNSAGEGVLDLRASLLAQFMDRYYPVARPLVRAIPGAAADAARVAGAYIVSRRGQTGMAFLDAWLGEPQVQAMDDGSLVVNALVGVNRKPLRWVETAPGYWRDSGGSERHLIFRQDEAGGWQFSSGWPGKQYQRAAWYQRRDLLLALLGTALCASAAVLAHWPLAALWRSGRAPTAPAPRRAQAGARLLAAATLLFWGSFAAILGRVGDDIGWLTADWLDGALRSIALLGWLIVAGALLLAWRIGPAWRAGPRRAIVLPALLCGAVLAASWVAWYANLLGPQVRY